MRGRLVVVALVVVGLVLATVAALMRGRNVPRLPLAPGSALLITVEQGGLDLGPFAAEAVEFTHAHGVSRDRTASLAAIATGRMPRENGLVRAGDSIAADVATVAERLGETGFVTAVFPASTSPAFRGERTDVANLPAEFFDRRGTAPSLAHVHFERDGAAACAALWRDLFGASSTSSTSSASGAAESARAELAARLVVVAAALDDPEHPRLAIRLPRGLLAAQRESRDVSLLDVAPTLLETFGVPVESPLMEPFLLGPRTSAPRFFLITEPLDAKRDASLVDCDAVRLLAASHRYVVDPREKSSEWSDEPRALDELRVFLYSGFGYRVDAFDGRRVARFVGVARRR